MLHNYASTVAPADTERRYCRKCHQVLDITERYKACEGCRAKERASARARREARSANVRSELSRAFTSRPRVAPNNYSSASASPWTAPSQSVGYSFTPVRNLLSPFYATQLTRRPGSLQPIPRRPPAYAAAPVARPSGIFLERFLADIALATWLATLQSVGMTEANLRVMADWEEPRRDALIAKVVPAMSIMDRALLGEAISRL
ncbi:hypothetical protein GGX14DRAFT_458329 [Mycena pura]|uniref:SBP-type domain-containing protein n=1 Tax=Mycena pura TaxID=153505 RepID=A0AAD6YAH7_9AGAR|nr:hypothetical protein GGX14DRAFT_458329 [Mycena pura]